MAQRIIDRSYVGEVLQRIYASRLNAKLVISLMDGYFYMEFAERRLPLQGTTIEEAVTDLARQLAMEFPQSPFASWWQLNFLYEDKSKD